MARNPSLLASKVAAPTRIAAAIVLDLTFLAACGSQTDQPVVTGQQLAGTWTSSVGGTIALRADHHFVATGLRLTYYSGGSANCPRATMSGTWQFLTAQWQPAGAGATQGNVIELDPAWSPAPVSIDPSCSGGPLTFIPWVGGWFWDNTMQLCQASDPDSTCDGYVFTKRK
jgi:hypothetical protein